MGRSLWKGPYTLHKKPTTNSSLLVSRNLELTPNLLDASITVHNGRKLTELVVSGEMLGRKAGEFAFTRADYKYKRKKKKKSRGSKRKS